METLQNEHERLWKSSKGSKAIDQTQDIIDALQRARNAIADDPTSAQITLAKLQNPVKTAFDGMNTSLKEVYGGQNKYGRALDKLFKDKILPSDEVDPLSGHSTLINRAIYLHLLREGLFDVANTLHAEAEANLQEQQNIANSLSLDVGVDHPLGLDKLFPENIQKQFSSMYNILSELKKQNLQPAIEWARQHSKELEIRGSNLEFELCRLQYVTLFLDGNNGQSFELSSQIRALEYAQNEMQNFRGRYLNEISQLLGAVAFCENLEDSPYSSRFNNTTAWSEVGNSFTRQFCSLLELSADSPLYLAATAGAIALPTLAKLQNIMVNKRTEWTTGNEMPVETPLPPSYHYHSIFVCPVSKEQTTDQNPPMIIPCGHVLAQESLQTLSKGSRFKCPYCPRESHPKDAKRVYL